MANLLHRQGMSCGLGTQQHMLLQALRNLEQECGEAWFGGCIAVGRDAVSQLDVIFVQDRVAGNH
jgi:hypothetical protein